MIKISFITVTFNNSDELKNTLASLPDEPGFEVIIVNGGEFLSITPNFRKMQCMLVQEHDEGIYDAMNKGMRAAQGEYLLFLNSGDTLNNGMGAVLRDTPINRDLVLFECNEVDVDGAVYRKQVKSEKYWTKTMPTHHQAMLFSKYKQTLNDVWYDVDYKIASDYLFFREFLSFSDEVDVKEDNLITFFKGGRSYATPFLGLVEQFFIRRRLDGALSATTQFFFQLIKIGVRRKLNFIYRYFKNANNSKRHL